MSKLMDKQTALQDFVEKYVLHQWEHELLAIDQRYNQNKANIENGLTAAFAKACEKALKLQDQGPKGDIQYIYLSLLRTSIMNNTAMYRIEAYDQNWYLDQEECYALWEADFIFKSLFQNMNELETKKADYARKITSMDIERIKQNEAIKYHILAVEFIREMLPRLIETDGYKQMGKTLDISIMAGEYMDQSEILDGKLGQ